MEIFGFLVPMWALFLLIYLAGMPLIGYPMGKMSLRVWKNPQQYSHWARMCLFTLQEVRGDVGKYWKGPTDGNGEYETSLPRLFASLGIHEALQHGDLNQLKKYVGWTMIFWPLRIWYTMIALFFESVILVIKLLVSLLT